MADLKVTAESAAGVSRLDSLTGLRFYAALVVVILHVTREYAPVPLIRELFAPGGVGVSFFFILSGFVLMWSMRPNLPKRDFYRNRFARVYPLHLVTWAMAGVVILVGGLFVDPWVALASLALVQSWIPLEAVYFSMNGPSWSLSAEAFFYAVFPWVARPIRRASTLGLARGMFGLYAVIVVVTIAGHILLRGGPTVAFFYVNPLYRLWEFLIGMSIAVFVQRGWRTRIGLPISLSLVSMVFVAVAGLNFLIENGIGPVSVLGMRSLPNDITSLIMVPFFVLLIGSAASSDLRGKRSHLRSPLLMSLGKWSFALYLTHLLLVSLLSMVVPRGMPWQLSTIVAVLTVLSAIGISALFYRHVEHPLEARLRAPRKRAQEVAAVGEEEPHYAGN
ncbi:acyltransferase family protein [Cryobacterium tagatosivorans]|uniref:acyltransferase family protein n=1 Tax=Cryobacterium tagatosivorans TaxID=1259199 RepID=UPI00141B9551|nr:acyltransferase [Cryobacterium tagatosivorans]